MISAVRSAEILQCARQVVRDHGFTAIPVTPKEIARQKDIAVQPFHPNSLGISGVLMMVNNRFSIGYSTAIGNVGFENFTIAHELGHYFLDGHALALLESGAHYSKSGYMSKDVYEKEADLFASELLMPEFLFRGAIAKGGFGFALIKRLAEEAETSIVATAIRYAKIADDPVAVILSEGEQVQWCFMSDCLRECRGVAGIAKRTLIPPRAPTYAFNRDDENIKAARQVEDFTSLKTWFADAPDIEMQEDVVGLGHYGKTLTVLFSETALEEDDEDLEGTEDGADTGMPSARWTQRDRCRD
jgi:hypothetical protein